MRTFLARLKQLIALLMKRAIVGSSLPLGVQAWVIRRLLPMDPWPRSLAYQQCLANRILSRHGAVTQGGPFKGMTCIRDANEGCLVPKLLGCYEEELTPAVEQLIERGYDRVIDVGCASGYWLTGLALRIPQAQICGFEIDQEASARCSELVQLNGVQNRVRLFGRCTQAEIERLVEGRTLIFMDCDGPEYELLDPELAPSLRRADIIVECHDYLNPRITPSLLERFVGTHEIERVQSRPRQASAQDYPGLLALPAKHWAAALDERRPCVQEWLVMVARRMQNQ